MPPTDTLSTKIPKQHKISAFPPAGPTLFLTSFLSGFFLSWLATARLLLRLITTASQLPLKSHNKHFLTLFIERTAPVLNRQRLTKTRIQAQLSFPSQRLLYAISFHSYKQRASLPVGEACRLTTTPLKQLNKNWVPQINHQASRSPTCLTVLLL